MTPTEHPAKTQSPRTGIFASLRAFLRVNGTHAPTHRRASLALLAAVAFSALTATPALAAAPEPPETKPATLVTATSATLNGILNPNASALAGWQFGYSDAGVCTLGFASSLEPEAVVEALSVQAALTELEPNKTYSFCLLATHIEGEAFESTAGAELSFKTLAAPPKVDSESAASVNSTAATLEAQVNPNNESTTYTFEYSTEATGEKLEGTPVKLNGASALEGGSVQTATVPRVEGLAPGTTYFFRVVAENAQSVIEAKPVQGPVQSFTTVPTPNTDAVSALTPRTATFHGHLTLDPVDTQYSFDYNPGVSCTGATSTVAADAGSAPGGEFQASTPVTGLLPNTQYAVCLVTSNVSGTETGPPVTFTTPAAQPTIEDESVTDVSGDSATLNGQVNPGGSPTTYHFDYGTTASYGASTPVSPALPADNAAHPATAHIQGLLAGTLYHYRLVASNPQSPPGGTPGPDRTFTTQGAAPTRLADGREWELVSPPDKHDALIGSRSLGAPIQASEDGSAITYGTNVPTEDEPPGYGQQGSDYLGQVLSKRGAGGWSTRDIATPHEAPTDVRQRSSEYLFFSPDLSLSLTYPLGADQTLLSSQASESTPYVRREGLCDAPATAAECYLPVVTGKEGFADVPPGTKFGVGGNGGEPVVFEGASPDMRHVLLKSSGAVALTGTPIEQGAIYEWSAGVPAAKAMQLVSALPASEGGGPATSGGVGMSVGPSLLFDLSGFRHSISADGARVFWEAAPEKGGGTALYLRDTQKGELGESVRLDVQQPGAPTGEAPGAQFEAASTDGSRVYFTDAQRLTERSGTGYQPGGSTEGGDLYECRIFEELGHLKCGLSDLTPEQGGMSAEVRNMISGASEDGSFVYFVANGVLGDGGARGATRGECQEGGSPSATCNLYQYHGGVVTFIATLSAEDQFDWGGLVNGFHILGLMTAQSSPDGRYLAFMSDRSLTGYDNRDAHSGKPDEEVYRYDSVAGEVACVSCNPTGARPVGVPASEFEPTNGRATPHSENVAAVVNPNGSNHSSLAANLPGLFFEALYQPRYISDKGRLFFNSSDALVPQDVNNQEDVYEWEPAGVGGCSSSASGFSATTAGCVSLVSSGTSSQESGFLDASAVGPGGEEAEDVFFLTSSPLSPSDRDTAYDVYDAHRCSSQVPCSAVAVAAPACDSEAACRAAPSPQPGIFGAPASQTYQGPGNAAAAGPPPARAISAAQLRAQKLTRALRACRAKRNKHKRAVCVKRAHRLYGPVKAKKAATSHRRAG